MRKFIAFGPALVVLITALVTLVAAPAAVRLIGYAGTDSQIQLARHDLEQDNILKQIDKAVRNIADAVEPSVVHISVEEGGRGWRSRASQGSGWVLDKLGHIVTNAHVVRGATRIVVQFNDGRAADATVVGADAGTDVAVIKVATGEGLFPVQRATGLELHQGERVYAFGSPFGFKFSMSEGIISGLGRDPREIMNNPNGYTNFIQTDAAVNPGNSGGPLVNVDGRLVGMNVAIATARTKGNASEGQNSGISFAIPLSTIERVVEQLVSGGVVTRGYLGIGHQEKDDENQGMLNRLGFHGRGVGITRVECRGPSEKSGLLVNDVITKVNGQPVTGVPGLRSAIANNAPGDKVKVEVWRAGETQRFEIELGRMVTDAEVQQAWAMANTFGILNVGQTRDRRVVVMAVQPGSAANDAGVTLSTQILEVGGCPIRSLDEFFSALASRGLQNGQGVPLALVFPDGIKREVTVPGK